MWTWPPPFWIKAYVSGELVLIFICPLHKWVFGSDNPSCECDPHSSVCLVYFFFDSHGCPDQLTRISTSSFSGPVRPMAGRPRRSRELARNSFLAAWDPKTRTLINCVGSKLTDQSKQPLAHCSVFGSSIFLRWHNCPFVLLQQYIHMVPK